MRTRRVNLDVHLRSDDLRADLRADAKSGLTASPKELPPKWFYDETGCGLYEMITRLDEYYPTRRERSILEVRSDEIASLSGASTLVELGSGTSEKTRLLLAAFSRRGGFTRFVPFDVSEPTLRDACETIAAEHDGLEVHGIVGDFERHLDRLPRGDRRLIAFLGSTIGNLYPAQRAKFLSTLVSGMAPGDGLLMGTDLVKDVGRLERAYDDASGVTAAFNLNVLQVLNRELHANFVLRRFEHRAFFDTDNEWVDIRLRSRVAQTVSVRDLDIECAFDEGEEMRTEISAKFRREGVEAELGAAGLEVARWWTDPDGDFALSLSFRSPGH